LYEIDELSLLFVSLSVGMVYQFDGVLFEICHGAFDLGHADATGGVRNLTV
jgi:hypothetical protein